jgi:TRAP-type C4-dicarboxylate transport system permease large subunit
VARPHAGGLLHTNIAASGVFSAISGSSVATAATMGSVALPFFKGTRYDPKMVLGSLAAGGALGNLIPPGITFIIYGLITETSVGALYLAAVGPSILVWRSSCSSSWSRPRAAPPSDRPPNSAAEKLRSLVGLLPTAILILIVLGTIYGGLATATESAALGVVGAMVFAAIEGKLTFRMLNASAEATARNTALIGLILFGAYLLNYCLRRPRGAADAGEARLRPAAAAGRDHAPDHRLLSRARDLHGGILHGGDDDPGRVPDRGGARLRPDLVRRDRHHAGRDRADLAAGRTVLYVLQGMRRTAGPITDVFSGVIPFMLAYIGAVFLLLAFPAIALWLPRAWS